MINSSDINKLKAGDPKALEKIYDVCSPSLLGIILRIVKTEDIAKEVLQETYIKIWKNANSYDDTKGRFFTWASRIAKNTAINYINLKSEKKQGQTICLEKVDANREIQTPNIDVLDIRGKVNQLEFKYKQLIDLLYFQGYTQKEVSDKLSIPLGTVKTRIRSAMSQLKAIYLEDVKPSLDTATIAMTLLMVSLI